MRSIRRPLLLVLLLSIAAAACNRLVAPTSDALTGEWVGPRETWSDGVSPDHMDRLVTFGADGSYRFEVRIYGAYGQPAAQLSSWSKTEGRYRLEGDRLLVKLEATTSWDSFYGADSQERVERLDSSGYADSGQLRLRGDELVHTYLSYPADAPVETVMVYRRAR